VHEATRFDVGQHEDVEQPKTGGHHKEELTGEELVDVVPHEVLYTWPDELRLRHGHRSLNTRWPGSARVAAADPDEISARRRGGD